MSQNASKEKHRIAHSGIAGCVTPGGDFFVPHKGRPLLGCEKLLIQGLPYFRLVLGNESEVQLGDLAGNAMSLTVVSACMLGAITCRQLRDEMKGKFDAGEAAKGKKEKERFMKEVTSYLSKKAILSSEMKQSDKETSFTESLSVNNSTSAIELFKGLAEISQDAIKVSITDICLIFALFYHYVSHKYTSCYHEIKVVYLVHV